MSFYQGHRLRGRDYHNPGPNYVWHIDGYDKLKPFGFSIHAAIDGFNRKVLWPNVTRSNKCPNTMVDNYLKTVTKLNGILAVAVFSYG